MSVIFWRFEILLLSKSLADDYGLCRLDAFLELTADLDIRCPMFFGHLTLRPIVLNGLEVSQAGNICFGEATLWEPATLANQ